jgi:sugar phosphate isomerase/epimerase
MITLTGFADEAGADLPTQIKATRELGWHYLEARAIDGKNIHDLDDDAFARAATQLTTGAVQVNCFGSAIMNWGHQITEDFAITLATVQRTIPRMQKLQSKLIRIMSYAVLKNADDTDAADQLEAERFRRLREVKKLFEAAGIVAVHENCMNYGGMSWQHTLKMVEQVPGLRLVFDTGNPIFTADRQQPAPYPRQSAWEFYTHVKPYISYLHIKDGTWDAAAQKCIYSYPGDGVGDVVKIMRDVTENGYQGFVSIEPHIGKVFHEKDSANDAEALYKSYVEYGRRFMKILDDLGIKYQ